MQAEAKASACPFNFYPVGRATQAAVCKTAEAGATPARDSIFRDANTGAGQDLTGLAAAVQLRLRVASLSGCKHCSDAAVS
jgi:hypothetical protein